MGKIYTPGYLRKTVIKEKYVDKGLSIRQVADELLCSKEAIRNALTSMKVPLRDQNQHHGRPSQPRYGYHYRNGKLVKHLGESRLIIAVQEMRSEGMSLRKIAQFLDQIGVPTKCRGKAWHPQMVKNILDKNQVLYSNNTESPKTLSC